MNWGCQQPHVRPMRMRSGRDECLLRDDHVGPDVHMVLIVKPDAFADPSPITNVQLPGKLYSCSRSKYYVSADIRSEHAKNFYPQGRTDLPRVCDEDQFHRRPEEDHCPRLVPRGTLARRL